jgi:hypothetical protein
MSNPGQSGRRGFLWRTMALGGVSAAPSLDGFAQTPGPAFPLPSYARARNYQSLKQSSHDATGGNADSWRIAPGATQELFNSAGPGVISHIRFTIAAMSPHHLKELVLWAYWDGNAKPSVDAPIGDFFGLNLGQYQIYESAYLVCSFGMPPNCHFAISFRESARHHRHGIGRLLPGELESWRARRRDPVRAS